MPRCDANILVLCMMSFILGVCAVSADDTEGSPSGVTVAVGPVVGWDKDTLKMPGRSGMVTTEKDTAPEYGIFFIAAHPNLVINNFLFFTHVNDTDILGDFLFANYYMDDKAPVTLNAGVGYLYHNIKPEKDDITVEVPMLKTGPRIRIPALNMTVNPYIGYSWEMVDTMHGNQDNEAYLFGVSAHWRWRMMDANVNYYYQDNRDIEEDFQTVRARFNIFLNKTWGLTARIDYMEHEFTKDTSILIGPVVVF